MDKRTAVVSSYDRWASTYDTDRNATRDLDAEVLRRSGPPVGGRDVLEIGCGTGKNTTWLAEHARSVIALDFSPRMLARARERVRGDHVTFLEHDVTRAWPIPSETVDAVVVSLVLEHVSNLDPFFAEAARVLRRGGHLFLSELHPDRQRAGGQAAFVDHSTGLPVRIAAYQHSVAEFVNGGLAVGLAVRQVGEFVEPSATPDATPRLLGVLFEK
jgi:ubiquinone/menaquinone biosynthesis C-methylase UbiE